MSSDRPNPEAIPPIGEMPTPRYMSETPSTIHDGMTKWIGVEAYSTKGELGEFHWWRNFSSEADLNDRATRYHVAAFIARVTMATGAQVAVGLPIDLGKSDSATGRVEVIEDPKLLGVYVEKDRRPMFNFFAMMDGVPSEAELRKKDPVGFDELFQKAKAVLPMPKAPDIQAGSEHVLDERIKFLTGDLTEIETDAIVCPTLPDLDVIYTGVAGAVMRRGGDRIFAEARRIGAKARRENPDSEFVVPLYSAHITNGGDLPNSQHVIHSVAVNFTEKGLSCDPEAIFKSAWNVMEVADANGLRSVAFPALGAGLYQVPLEQSFGAIAQATDMYLREHPETSIKQVTLVSRDPDLPKPSLTEELVADGWARELRARRN